VATAPAHRVRDHCLAPGRAAGAPIYAGRYGRLFPQLTALATEGEFLRMLGRPGGACDGGLAADADESDDAREAGGDELGPTGGRIVGDVLVGIVERDPQSFLSVDPDWRPTLREEQFGIADLLTLATGS
jgi:hypothetical protein